MGWIEKIETRPAHTCGWPGGAYLDAERIAAGSIWECDDCGTRWRFDGWRYGVASAQNDRDAIWTNMGRPDPGQQRPQRTLGPFGSGR